MFLKMSYIDKQYYGRKSIRNWSHTLWSSVRQASGGIGIAIDDLD